MGPLCMAGGNVKQCSHYRKQNEESLKDIYRITHSYSSSGRIPKGTESSDLNRYLQTNVHSSFIHNRPKVEITQMSIDRWINNM